MLPNLRGSAPLYFVLCPSFHGATLLSLLLNNHPDIVALGDTNPRKDASCACGRTVCDCPFWTTIARECRADRFAHCRTLLPTLPQVVRHQKSNRAFNAALAVTALGIAPAVWHTVERAAKEYVDVWAAFRRLAIGVGGAKIMVDGQKSVSKFLINRSLGRFDPHIIHLIRDPRGYAASARNHLDRPLRDAATEWKWFHRRICWVARSVEARAYLRVRYEDLATQPAVTMRRVFEFLKVNVLDVYHAPTNSAIHHLVGNRMLFDFRGEILYDSSWVDSLSKAEQASIRHKAQPLFSRFGYR
jgi:hypothetical protein